MLSLLSPGYETKPSDGEVPVILEIWGMQISPSLLSLPSPLWPGVIELRTNIKLNYL